MIGPWFVLATMVSIIVAIVVVSTLVASMQWLTDEGGDRWMSFFRKVLPNVSAAGGGLTLIAAALLLVYWLWSIVPEQEYPW